MNAPGTVTTTSEVEVKPKWWTATISTFAVSAALAISPLAADAIAAIVPHVNDWHINVRGHEFVVGRAAITGICLWVVKLLREMHTRTAVLKEEN